MVDPGCLLEIEVEIGRRVVVEVIADQEDEIQCGPQSVQRVAGGGKPFRCAEDRGGVFGIALGPFVEGVDDVRIGNDADVEGVRVRSRLPERRQSEAGRTESKEPVW